MSETTYQKNKDDIINRTENYEFLRERARNKYRELPEEENNEKKRICKK